MSGIETAEIAGGPHDGSQVRVDRQHDEVLIWYRGGDSIEFGPDDRPAWVHAPRKYPTRHRYVRTGRRTAGGATVFRHAGRIVGLFPAE